LDVGEDRHGIAPSMSRQRNALLPENTPTSPEAGRRRTLTGPSLLGLKLGASGYLLPFVFALNPALLMQGSMLAVTLAFITVVWSGFLIAWATEGSIGRFTIGGTMRLSLLASALIVGSATVWLGPQSLGSLLVALAGAAPVGLAIVRPGRAQLRAAS